MKKTNTNLMICAMVFAVALVVSNILAAKIVQTNIPLGGGTILVPSAVICYCITFLMTDVVGETWGPREARSVVFAGFGCQLMATTLIIIAQCLPAADPTLQEAYEMLLGQNAIFFIASMLAYLLSQSWDVFIFHRIRRAIRSKDHSSRRRWIWNNVSTMTSQIIDTIVFIGIAFGIGMGWLFDSTMIVELLLMMLGQYICKLVLAAIDTPFFYLLTRQSAQED